MTEAAWNQIQERGNSRAVRWLLTCFNLLGYRFFSLLLWPIALYTAMTGRSGRLASWHYFEQLYHFDPKAAGPPTFRKILKHHHAFAQSLLDRVCLWQGKLDRFEYRHQGSQHMLRDKPPGAMLVGSHIGSFDILRAIALDKSVRIHVVMYRAHTEILTQLLSSLNADHNLRVIEIQPGNINQVFELKECVDKGDFVAVLADRLPPTGRNRITHVPFLGRKAAFPQNTWILASLLECPVLFAKGFRTGPRKYSVAVEPFADRIVLPRKRREEALEAYIRDYAQRLEALCRIVPYQWFNFYEFWGSDDS